jgi:geranylgeranyl diphosphate synthase type I
MVDVLPALSRYRAAVAQEMRDTLRGNPHPIYAMQRYHLGWEDESGTAATTVTGKMFRPALCLLCCEAVGGEYERALAAAAAIEFLHNFSLIHDDIEDNSRFRHGRRAVWDIWGIPNGINAGDSMLMTAHLALHRLSAHDFEPRAILNAFLLFDRAAQRLCEGQDTDLRFEQRESVSMSEYDEMIAGKTGALIGVSAALGALLGGAPAATVALFERFGRLLGRAFQIRDDILGVWGEEQRTGKPSGQDIRSRKKSYPIVRALEVAPAADRARLLALYNAPADQDLDDTSIDEVLVIFERNAVRILAADEAQGAADRAVALLDQGNLTNPARRELSELAGFVASRSA